MENNKNNQGATTSKSDEKTSHPSKNTDKDYVDQTGKSQNSGNDSDFLKNPDSKGKPENLSEGSEFLNDVIEENNPSREKETDTKEFYNHADTMTGNSNTGNSNTGNSSWSTGNSGTSNSGLSTDNSDTNVETDEDEFGPETGNSGSQNYKDKAPNSYDYIDPQDQRDRNNSSNIDGEDEDFDQQDPRGKVKPTMIDEEENDDSADLEDLQVRRNNT